MAKEYVIDAARQGGNKPNPHGGELTKWYLDVHSVDGSEAYSGDEDVYTQKKPGNNLSAGEHIFGRIEQGEYGWRFYGEKRDGYSPQENTQQTGQSNGYLPDDEYNARVRWGLALKLANERACHNVAPTATEDWVARVKELAEAIWPVVNEGPWLAQTPQSPSEAPVLAPNVPDDNPAVDQRPVSISREAVKEAADAYLNAAGEKDSEGRAFAKNKIELFMGSIGVEDPQNMNELQKQQVYDFLLAGPEDTDIPF